MTAPSTPDGIEKFNRKADKMKFKRIDRGITQDGKFYRTTFQSTGPEIVDYDVDVAVGDVHRDPSLRARHEDMAMKEHGITEGDIEK